MGNRGVVRATGSRVRRSQATSTDRADALVALVNGLQTQDSVAR